MRPADGTGHPKRPEDMERGMYKKIIVAVDMGALARRSTRCDASGPFR